MVCHFCCFPGVVRRPRAVVIAIDRSLPGRVQRRRIVAAAAIVAHRLGFVGHGGEDCEPLLVPPLPAVSFVNKAPNAVLVCIQLVGVIVIDDSNGMVSQPKMVHQGFPT